MYINSVLKIKTCSKNLILAPAGILLPTSLSPPPTTSRGLFFVFLTEDADGRRPMDYDVEGDERDISDERFQAWAYGFAFGFQLREAVFLNGFCCQIRFSYYDIVRKKDFCADINKGAFP